ncbi:peptide methionine sulfoxide reductase [Halobacteriales archaeon QH_10_67_22]|nr:MAG: peptide methionine sulfoxide reductase [Halobacteriales archaeon QH_10_67_22]
MDPERIRAYDETAPAPDETETATVALGCFWGPDATFGARESVVRTRVGYAGGSTPDPTYHDIGDHSEALQVDYDPDVVSFADLVDLAIRNHDPRRQTGKRQYQNVLFYGSPGERETIETALGNLAMDASTRVEQLDAFTLAETYHQKYNLRNKRALLADFEDAGYDDAGIRDSPAAATLNGRIAGHEVADIAAVQ